MILLKPKNKYFVNKLFKRLFNSKCLQRIESVALNKTNSQCKRFYSIKEVEDFIKSGKHEYFKKLNEHIKAGNQEIMTTRDKLIAIGSITFAITVVVIDAWLNQNYFVPVEKEDSKKS